MLRIAQRPAFLRSAGVAIVIATLGFSPSARAQSLSFEEFPIPTGFSGPVGIAAGSDGALWFTELGSNKVGRISTIGVITEEFPIPTANSSPTNIAAGPDGALWFTENGASKIGRIDTLGHITEFLTQLPLAPLGITAGPDGELWFTERGKIGEISTVGVILEYPTPAANGTGLTITAGPDGALWYTDNGQNKIGRITVFGAITGFAIPTARSTPEGITAGPDGALWFVELDGNKIGRITTAGVFTEFPIPTANSNPLYITTGPDGALWFTENNANQIGRITTDGVFTEFGPIPTASSAPAGITVGPDGALWFTENNGNRIGRLFPGTNAATSPLFAAVLPASRSVEVGGNVATAFATIINSGSTAVNSCGIAPVTSVPASFMFQTTDPATNALTGTPNTPIPIAAGASQTFLVAFTPNAPMVPTNVVMGFDCSNTPAAAPIVGVNTLLLTFSATPVPDIVALAASGDPGIVDIPGATGTGDFAVATVNVGTSGAITAAADTGATTLPVSLTICQTVPATGACMAPAAGSVTTTINANATPTFGIFVKGNGSNVAFDAANNRVFVRFRDDGDVTRGSTSVAVRTQ